MCRRGMIGAEQVVGTRNPLVEVFLNQPSRDYPRLDDTPEPVVARSHVERFLTQHV